MVCIWWELGGGIWVALTGKWKGIQVGLGMGRKNGMDEFGEDRLVGSAEWIGETKLHQLPFLFFFLYNTHRRHTYPLDS